MQSFVSPDWMQGEILPIPHRPSVLPSETNCTLKRSCITNNLIPRKAPQSASPAYLQNVIIGNKHCRDCGEHFEQRIFLESMMSIDFLKRSHTVLMTNAPAVYDH